MRSILEILRVMVLLFLFLWILDGLESFLIRRIMGETQEYTSILLFFSNLLLFLVLYRNKLQFSGWDPSYIRKKKLSPRRTASALIASALLFIVAFLL
ncbi:hypothetical protein [Gorillibacterium sp. sgz5001074]|uniref:hypothetical protein n=1 Tax=Gorillibacterium sp. sgz5001074 TaxID=3446695 RepID=UPI003F67731C